jgi:UTP--glucose-1-phosphate uridylyltransferase
VTKAQPKEMLPLVDKPTIQYGVEEAILSGVEEVVMVTGGGKRAIVDHFDRSLDLEFYLRDRGKDALLAILRKVDELADRVDIVYVQQRQPLGLGHAVWTARRQVEGEACAVLLADDVILGQKPCLQQLIDVYAETGATVLAVRRVAPDEVSRYGIVAVAPMGERVHRVVDMVEKPALDAAPSQLAIFGRYVLAPDVFLALDHCEPGAGGEIQLTDAIRRTIQSGQVVAFEFEGDYYDTGTVPGYLKANLALALRREDLRETMLEVIGQLVGASDAVQ